MTKQQFDAAVVLIRQRVDLSDVDDSILDGCGLAGFVPVTIPLKVAAKAISWHAMQLNGQFDAEALNEIRGISRKKWLICD